MKRVLLCYPLRFTVNPTWITVAQEEWNKVFPEENAQVVPSWDLLETGAAERARLFDGFVVMTPFVGEDYALEPLHMQVARAALALGKEVRYLHELTDLSSGIKQVRVFLKIDSEDQLDPQGLWALRAASDPRRKARLKPRTK